MLNPIGTYIWHRVEDENNITGPKEDQAYIICTEQPTAKGSCWRMDLARWYEKGSELNIKDSKGTVHHHKIVRNGFYLIPEYGKENGSSIYLIHGVQYWTEIKSPNVDPDSIITIVG